MYKTFLTIVFGAAACLFSLGLFLNYFKQVSENIRIQHNTNIPPIVRDNVEDTRSLIEIQNKILGYKNSTVKKWSPDDPKPEKVVIDNMPKEIECLDNDCRWTKLVDN